MPPIDPRRPCYPVDFELLITSRINDPGNVGIFVGRAERPPARAARAKSTRAATAARAIAAPMFVLPFLGWVLIERGPNRQHAVLAHGGLDQHSVGPFVAEAFARVHAKWPGAPVRSVIDTSGLHTGIACPPPPPLPDPGPGPRPFETLAIGVDELIRLMTRQQRGPNDPP